MRIDFLCPSGPQPTEMVGLAEFRRTLPASWKGYANLNMRNPRRRGQDREIDVVIIAPDRLILVDLKHVRGRLVSEKGIWFKDGERLGASSANKIRENAKVMADLIRREVPQLRSTPPIESMVVFTLGYDVSGLDSNEREHCASLTDFIKIKDPAVLKQMFPTGSSFGDTSPLTGHPHFPALHRLFTNKRLIEARKTKYNGFVPLGQPEMTHRLFEEFACHEEADQNYTGVLRLWRFGEDPDAFSLEEARRPVADRERAVLGYVRSGNPAFYDNYVLRSLAHDREFSLNYFEVFERHQGLMRLTRFMGTVNDLDDERRLELARMFLDRVADLHRLRVAHRDLDRHSVWIDDRRSIVVLSNFGASHFPERETIGDKRARIVAGGFFAPEDVGQGRRGTPFQADVFLSAAVVWSLLTGERLPEVDGVPLWTSDSLQGDHSSVSPELRSWFEASLSLSALDRPADAVLAAQAFGEVLQRRRAASLDRQLQRYRREIDPVADHDVVEWIRRKPYRVFKGRRPHDESGAPVFVKSWPELYLGDRRTSMLRLVEFFSRSDKLAELAPRWAAPVLCACLSMDGLLLVQEWVDGVRLDATCAAGWSEVDLRTFLGALVGAVQELHDVGLSHGDLKPDNVLVVGSGATGTRNGGLRPVLVDLLDYAPADMGERTTSAYCPQTGGEDPQTRDRFALARIVSEVGAQLPMTSSLRSRIDACVAECATGEAAWTSLRPLAKAFANAEREVRRSEEDQEFRLSFELRPPASDVTLLADGGRFHVVSGADGDRVEIFGFDQKVTVDLDRNDGRPRKAFLAPVNVREAGWAFGKRTLSFSGEVRVSVGARFRYAGVDELLIHVRDRAQTSSRTSDRSVPATGVSGARASGMPAAELPPPDPTPITLEAVPGPAPMVADTGAAVVAATPDARPSGWQFPVARFWNETILVEEAIQPELTLIEAPRELAEPGMVALRCVEADGAGLLGGGAGDAQGGVSVSFNGARIGDVDLDRTKGGLVTLRNARGHRRLRPGDKLRIQNSGSVESFQRRSRALSRILRGRAQIPDLVSYFDPSARLPLQTMADAVPEAILGRYDLNDEQRAAFDHLWRHGPLGLLQGPPGTGKTRFIAAFVHHALNEGRMRNVLVLSQSHEAVNEVAERILEVVETVGGDIDLLRVGDHGKISPRLRRYHSQAVQDRYRELFRTDMKDRMGAPARRLGLDARYVREAYEIEATYGPLVQQMRWARGDVEADVDEDAVSAAQASLRALEAVFERRLNEDGDTLDGRTSEEVFEDLRDAVASRHRITDGDARRRLSRLHDLSVRWTSTLRGRGRTLEEFLARSRNLVCGTCVGIGRRGIRIDRGAFDLVVIDEAARCTPSELAVGMQSGKRVLLVGDHKQLPPLFDHELLGTVAERLGAPSRAILRRSDFERAFGSRYGGEVSRTLVRQYRMASEIHALVSDTFYRAEGLVQERPEPLDLYDRLDDPFRQQVLWLDTSGNTGSDTESGTSYVNRREAVVVIEALRRLERCTPFLDRLHELKLKSGQPLVGVICTYAQQAALIGDLIVQSDLSRRMRDLVRVDTVDAYQGKESRIVILSLVRSNFDADMGHVRSRNRINVAISRAMDRLLIVGAARMFSKTRNPLRGVVGRLRDAGRIRPASDILG